MTPHDEDQPVCGNIRHPEGEAYIVLDGIPISSGRQYCGLARAEYNSNSGVVGISDLAVVPDDYSYSPTDLTPADRFALYKLILNRCERVAADECDRCEFIADGSEGFDGPDAWHLSDVPHESELAEQPDPTADAIACHAARVLDMTNAAIHKPSPQEPTK